MRRRGRGFQLQDARGRTIVGEAHRERVRSLVIPPAWQDVWISPNPRGHIQATGVDGSGRRQYLYHDAWQASRSRAKFRRMASFGLALEPLRAQVELDLDGDERDETTVLAALARLLDVGFFRIGSERYAATNRTFGLTTLLREHATVKRDGTIVFDYTAKHGKRRVQRVGDERVGDIVGRLKRRRADVDPRLFAHEREDRWHAVHANELNAYLRAAAGGVEQLTAKDFRTWNATVLAAAGLARHDPAEARSQRSRAIAVNAVVRDVADTLGNTPAVCRSAYIDPRVIDRWAKGDTVAAVALQADADPDRWSVDERRAIEGAVGELLS